MVASIFLDKEDLIYYQVLNNARYESHLTHIALVMKHGAYHVLSPKNVVMLRNKKSCLLALRSRMVRGTSGSTSRNCQNEQLLT